MYIVEMPLSKSYQIVVKNNLLDNIDDEIKKVYSNKNIYIITDERVAELYLNRVVSSLTSFNVKTVVIKGYEEAKSLEVYAQVCEELIKLGASRDELLIALGGGVIGDLVGFVSATLYRGMPFVGIPTSLLAQVDSSIGGKTGIDFLGHKNILGVFNQPKLVLIDPKVLTTLPLRELKNGFGEIVKHALISSETLFDKLCETGLDITEELIYDNLLIKRNFVLNDEFDKNERMKLNFGHTFAHVIEMKYHKLHGEAVLDGILCAINYAIDLGVIGKSVKEKVINLYKKLDIDYNEYDYKEFFIDFKYDKKNIAQVINLILIDRIGNAFIHPVMESEL